MSADHSSDSLAASFRPARPAAPEAAPAITCFSILADCEPSVMPRVLELFAKRNLVPLRWISDVVGRSDAGGGRDLAIDLQVEGLEAGVADYIARCLRGLPTVERVLTSVKATL